MNTLIGHHRPNSSHFEPVTLSHIGPIELLLLTKFEITTQQGFIMLMHECKIVNQMFLMLANVVELTLHSLRS